ncbi:exonuclease domain-containing protein [Microcella frigidaquae]|uniref:DNA polymerase-3 subunit epsilon n=1 Tax=Microcella frigidaquae TaxID=424758 RepID=A0A840XEK0_9MICO|nr:exonuclease domain-containing protein [Microcella frigidaquae]MBB5616756.1 DNA polymerase-3 subunit epsilon [Microcella frigidaquae]NHN43802.1 3'-5' exonuclease [Microcella frigidaquae]
MALLDRELAVFDLETTGVDVRTARIVTACVAVLDASGTVVSRRDWLADPGVEIPEGAAAIHGITTERARAEGRPAAEVVAEVVAELRAQLAVGRPLVVYNAPYDLSLLAAEAARHGVAPLVDPAPVIDPLVLDKAVDRYRKGKRTLEVAAVHYGVTLDGAHDAGADAIAAGQVARALAATHAAALPATLEELHAAQARWHDQQADNFENYMRTQRDHSFTADRGWPVRG